MMGSLRVAAMLVLFGGVAVAQPKPSPPTTQQRAEIDRLAKRAISKSQANNHEGAIKDLLDAVAVHPTAANVLLTNIGAEYKQLKKPYEALKYFCLYLEKEPTGATATYVRAETEVLKKDLKLEGEACSAKPEPVKPEVKLEPVKPEVKGQPAGLTGTQNFDKGPSKPGSTLKIAGIGIGVAGAAVLAGGFVYGSKAKAKSDEISKGPPPVDATCTDPDPVVCPRLDWGPHTERGWDGIDKLQADGEKFEKMQIVFTVAGSAMVIGGAAMYFLGRSKKSTRGEMRVTPTIGPNTAGLTIGAGF